MSPDLRKTEAELRRAEKMEAVARLARAVSHDFNNILAVILSYAEIIASDLKPDEPLRADLEEIRAAALRGTALTRQLLSFSGPQVTDTQGMDLELSLAGMEERLGPLLGAQIGLTRLSTAGLWNIKADPCQIEQLVMNLAGNARDAMPHGGTLTIETANVELPDTSLGASLGDHPVTAPAGRYVVLAVSDTGVGMDAETQARIFEPFFSTKGKGKGTGLGLSTVFGIVRQSGGHIGVDSEPGKGATFRVYFRRVDT